MIKVNQVTKIFGQHEQKALTLLQQGWSRERLATEKQATVAVNQVSFAVEKGEIFVIMGLSGSGKSTLVRMLNRLIEPTSGEIWLKDRNISRLNAADLREVGEGQLGWYFRNSHSSPTVLCLTMPHMASKYKVSQGTSLPQGH